MDSRLGDRPCYEFGEFRLDANRRVIEAIAADRRLLLPPRIFDAALYFVRHRGLLLSKERLLAELWPGTVVEENSLSQVISLLRRALGESRRDNRYIVTVPRRGYRFVADVVRVASRSHEPLSVNLAVEVLSFDNWSTLTTTNDWRPALPRAFGIGLPGSAASGWSLPPRRAHRARARENTMRTSASRAACSAPGHGCASPQG